MTHRFVPIGDFQFEEEKATIIEVLDKGRLSEWEKVKEFERLFAHYIGTKYCLAVNSGTSSIILGLLALKYDERFPKARNGAKIITNPITYVATSNAIVLSNMEPVYVDIHKRTFKLMPELIENLLMEGNPDKFAGILPVHLMGYPNDMDELHRIADKYDLFIFEDSAQAHGTTYKGRKTGSLGLLAGFSFYIAHNIQAGEMGCVTTNDYKLFKLMKQLKAHGRMCNCPVCLRPQGKCPRINSASGKDDFDPRFTHEYIGYNFKAMEFQAALGVCQVKKANRIFERRLENVKYLSERLKKYNNLLYLPMIKDTISYLAYPLILREGAKINRAWIRRELEKRGVENRPLFGCIPTQQPAYSYLRDTYKNKLPIADYVGANSFYIGCHQYLRKDDLDYISEIFRDILG